MMRIVKQINDDLVEMMPSIVKLNGKAYKVYRPKFTSEQSNMSADKSLYLMEVFGGGEKDA